MKTKTTQQNINGENSFKYLIISVATILGIFVVGYFIFSIDYSVKKEVVSVVPIKKNKYNFEKLDLKAKAVFVWRIKTRETIFSFNEELQLPLASLSKIMTALTANELDQHKNDIVTISEENLSNVGDSGLEENEKWKLSNLIDFTLVASSNDGANAVATAIGGFRKISSGVNQSLTKKNRKSSFIDKMNKNARELGLAQTYFINESGLDIDEKYQSGAYGSAKDITKLFDFIIENRPNIVEATTYDKLVMKSESGIVHNVENTNEIINDIPWVIASKTGFTDLAGGNLVMSFDKGLMDPIIVAVLGSTQEGRFEDVKKIVDEILK